MERRTLGGYGEDRAVEWLTAQGYLVVERNWRCARGEIDVVARHDDTIVFVEVKTRAGATTGHPFEAITPTKAARLRRLVPMWFAAHPGVHAEAIRVDAVAVHVDGDRCAFEHVEGVQ